MGSHAGHLEPFGPLGSGGASASKRISNACAIPGLTGVLSIAGGDSHTCAVTAEASAGRTRLSNFEACLPEELLVRFLADSWDAKGARRVAEAGGGQSV